MRLADRMAQPVFVGVVALVLLFVTLPSVVVVIVAFGDKSIMMFPPDAWSLRWFERALTYP
jgi:putative spermidine/putrescine transport system permease protein